VLINPQAEGIVKMSKDSEGCELECSVKEKTAAARHKKGRAMADPATLFISLM
jgi:hypothetical protein